MSRSRNAFQQDSDLIVFSSAFRRLQDKTQVHPRRRRGQVRTRLTHSIEVASVGRSLGTVCAAELQARGRLAPELAGVLPHVVFAACLAHDIGNPPFGHGGEDAIGEWFTEHPQVLAGLDADVSAELCAFEGNAQGFRILTQLENYRFDGGLRLTQASLGAFMKYTCGTADADPRSLNPGARKAGFFATEAPLVEELRNGLGLPRTLRHPLAYLTEAADDICYAIIDIEDGHALSLIDHAEAVDVLEELAGTGADETLSAHGQIQKLRGIAIGRLVESVAARFAEREPSLMEGIDCEPLLRGLDLGESLSAAKQLAERRLFNSEEVQAQQSEGRQVLHTLLEGWVQAALEAEGAGGAIVEMPESTQMRLTDLAEDWHPGDRAGALRGIVDHVSALTDEYAVELAAEFNRD